MIPFYVVLVTHKRIRVAVVDVQQRGVAGTEWGTTRRRRSEWGKRMTYLVIIGTPAEGCQTGESDERRRNGYVREMGRVILPIRPVEVVGWWPRGCDVM